LAATSIAVNASRDFPKDGHVSGRSQDLILVGLRNGGLDSAQFNEAFEGSLGDVLELLHRSREYRVRRRARSERTENGFAQKQYFRE
jgi:hypothetical protein